MKKIIFLCAVFSLILLSGCSISNKNSGNFEKRKTCHDDAKGNEFVFYSPKFDACVEYFCILEKMDPEEFKMKITPGCEITDFYSKKLYKAFGCSSDDDCDGKLEKYK